MKATPDDPRLSAYLLGELPPEVAQDIRRQVAADPALRMSLDELAKTTAFLDGVLSIGEEAKLRPAQLEAIRRAAREESARGKLVELPRMRRSRNSWVAGLGAAAAVAIAALLMSRMDPGSGIGLADGPEGISDEIALLPMPGPSTGNAPTRVAGQGQNVGLPSGRLDQHSGEYLSKVARHWQKRPLPEPASLPSTGRLGAFSDGPLTRLPLVIGRSSLGWVSRWIREKRELPPLDAVRVEEMVNEAALSGGEEFGGMRLAIESTSCPWDPESILLGIQIEGGEEATSDLMLKFRSGAERRVLGSFSVRADGELPMVLPPKQRTLVLLELKGAGSQLGGIEVHQGSKVSMHLVPADDGELSDGLRHAAVLAGFGLWLRDEGVEAGTVARMLEEAGIDTDSVRADDRRMIEEALKLAKTKR